MQYTFLKKESLQTGIKDTQTMKPGEWAGKQSVEQLY